MARRIAAGQLLQGGGEARVHAGQRAPVGLVDAVLVGIGRALGQGIHLDRHVDQRGRQRQLAAQVVHLGQVVAQCQFALALERVLQRLRGDVRIAVAVAADPLAHAQEGRNALGAQRFLQLGIHPGDLAKEGGFVVAQRVLDFVRHGELGKAQQPRLPDLRHAGADLLLVLGQFDGRERVFLAREDLLALQDFIAQSDQLRDAALCVEDALALDLGRVRGENRRHVAVGQALDHRGGLDARLAQAGQRGLQAAFDALAGPVDLGAPADLVAVFRQVGQVTEVGEGANHADRLGGAQALEQVLQCAVGTVVGVAPEGHRERADLLDQVVGRIALLLADYVAEDAAEQPDVVDQWLVVVLAPLGGGRLFLGGFHFDLSPRDGDSEGRCCSATC